MTRNFDRAIHVTEVESFEGGPIEIRVWCNGPYSLQVTGRSALDFTYQLSSIDNADTNGAKPIHGDPVKGIIRKYNIVVSIFMVNNGGSMGNKIHGRSKYLRYRNLSMIRSLSLNKNEFSISQLTMRPVSKLPRVT